MADKLLKAGVIGCGMITFCHATALTRVPGVRIVATADIDESRAKAFAQRYQDGEFGLKVMEITAGAYQSMRDGRRITL